MLLRPGQRVLAHSVHQTALNMTVRSFGQAAAPKDFIKQRDAYRAEMSKLRKDWGEDHKQKMEEKAARDRAERRQLVLQRAIRLRAHREKVSRNLELERKKDEERRQRNREHLAKTHIMWEEDQAKKRRQRQAAMNDLIEESKYWITPENKNQLITPELFAKTPTTTGIVTPTSNYWRYEVFVPSLKRLLSNHFRESMMNMSNKELLQRHEGQGRVAKRALVETFLNDMIESSVDRANFRELVQNTVDDMEHTGTFETINQEVWNVNASLRDQFDSDSSSMGDDILDRDDCIAFLMECKEAGTLSKQASKLNFHTLSDEQLDALVTEHYLAEVSDASSDTSSDAGSDSGKTAAAPSKGSQQPGKKAKSYDSINRLLSE